MIRSIRLKWFVAVMLILSLALSACADSGSPAASPGSNGSGTGTDGGSAVDPFNPYFDPPITFTVGAIEGSTDRRYKAGENIHDNMVTRWFKEEFGIEVKHDIVVTSANDYDTRFQLLLASNGTLPDIFGAPRNRDDLMKSGRLLDITDAIEQYASPAVKALYDEYPQAFTSASYEGRIYGLPTFTSMDQGAVMWIREDWLDALDREAPTTIDELEDLMRAFVEEDPDGNQIDDTFGMALTLDQGPFNWMATADPIFGALTGTMANPYYINQYWIEKDGQLQYGAIDPSAKIYLEKMRDWIANGYVDNEAGVKDPIKAVELLVSGKAGITFGPNWMGQWPLEDAEKTIEGAKFTAYPLPAGPDGTIARGGWDIIGGTMMFSKDFEHIEAYFAILNKLFAKSFGDAEDPYYDEQFQHGWFEGYDYIIHDGQVIKRDFKDAGVPEDQWPLPDGLGEGVFPQWTMFGTFRIPYQSGTAYDKFYADPDAEALTEGEDRVKSMNRTQIAAGVISMEQRDADIFNLFTTTPTPAMERHGEILTKLATETYLRIIYGEQPVDYFDTFVEEWKTLGGDQVTQEVNEWYESVK